MALISLDAMDAMIREQSKHCEQNEPDAALHWTVFTKTSGHFIVNIYHDTTHDGMTLDFKNLDWLSLSPMRNLVVYRSLVQLALRFGVPGSAIHAHNKVARFIQRVQKRRHNRLVRWVIRRWRDLLVRRWALCRDAWEVWMMRAARPGEGKLYLYWANQYEKTTMEYMALQAA